MKSLPLLLALFSGGAAATSLDDQFGHSVSLDTPHRQIFFAADMAAGKLVYKAFGQAKDDKMKNAGVLYVADISAMPGFVAKLFAKPKMRKYPYWMLLDEKGQVTADWPRQDDAVTVIEGNKHWFCKDVSCLQKALVQP